MISESEYIEIAKAMNRTRECNWVDKGTAVAEVCETFNPELRRKFFAEALVEGTEYEEKIKINN